MKEVKRLKTGFKKGGASGITVEKEDGSKIYLS